MKGLSAVKWGQVKHQKSVYLNHVLQAWTVFLYFILAFCLVRFMLIGLHMGAQTRRIEMLNKGNTQDETFLFYTYIYLSN